MMLPSPGNVCRRPGTDFFPNFLSLGNILTELSVITILRVLDEISAKFRKVFVVDLVCLFFVVALLFGLFVSHYLYYF